MESTDAEELLKTKDRTPKQNKELSAMLYWLDFTKDKSDLYFTNLTLEGIVFDYAKLTNCNFEHATLNNCTLKYATLNNCTFKRAKLNKCNFNYAKLNDCSFNKAEIYFCEYEEATLGGTDFQYTTILETTFNSAFLQSAKFNRSEMTGVSFVDSNLLEADFDNVTFNLYANGSGQTDFDDATTVGATFENIIAIEDDDAYPIVNLNLNHNPSTHISAIKKIGDTKTYLTNRTRRKNLLSQVKRRIPSLSSMALSKLDKDDLEWMQQNHPTIINHDLSRKYASPKSKGGRKKKTRKNRGKKKLV